ncbi:MAG: DinB family protein [Chloroherpetonaceae bacterium]|nr:DinB family protein [Chthonomonadaceae bacterium]MDW8206864.1 DinB family protein [Chloroherpetonaceae bacterium]
MQALAEYLKHRAERSFRAVLKALEYISPEQARRDHHDRWPDHIYGIGQDGSIAGIVYHLAAWKQLTLPLFQPGGRALSRHEFDPSAAPALDDWFNLVAWYKQVGTAWQAELERLPPEALTETRRWEGHEITMPQFIAELYEHDVYHLAQIEYLLQKHRADAQA